MIPGDEAVDRALDTLAEHLQIRQVHDPDSHTALCLFGLDEDVVIEAIGMYLVGLLAGIVRTNLELSAVMLAQTPAGRAQLFGTVEALLHPAADATDEAVKVFDANVRDPWIAEAIGHAVLAVRGRADTECLDGRVAALTVPHPQPSQQGVDLFAIYDDGGLPAMALGEAKATRANGSARLTQAIGFFRTVEDGDRDVDILMQVTLLREALDPALQQGLSASFWHERACYLPVIAHGDDVDMSAERPSLAAIDRAASHKRVIHCRPEEYTAFFDAVATATLSAVDTITP
ncbi:MAG: hypothetical protein WKF96_04710 [Solirubrobacteraceae bacterium]